MRSEAVDPRGGAVAPAGRTARLPPRLDVGVLCVPDSRRRWSRSCSDRSTGCRLDWQDETASSSTGARRAASASSARTASSSSLPRALRSRGRGRPRVLPSTPPSGRSAGPTRRSGRGIRRAPRSILASTSPQRRAILEQLRIPFDPSRRLLEQTAGRRSGRASRPRGRQGAVRPRGGTPVLGVDTTVVSTERVYGKPRDQADARADARELAGATHEVVSGLCLITPGWRRSTARRRSRSARSTTRAIARYVASGEWQGRAGAMRSRGAAPRWSSGSRATTSTSSACPARCSSAARERFPDARCRERPPRPGCKSRSQLDSPAYGSASAR